MQRRRRREMQQGTAPYNKTQRRTNNGDILECQEKATEEALTLNPDDRSPSPSPADVSTYNGLLAVLFVLLGRGFVLFQNGIGRRNGRKRGGKRANLNIF